MVGFFISMRGIIYCYHNLITGKKYIGQTIKPELRYKQHISQSKRERDKFHTAMRKNGVESFVYGVIEEIEEKELDSREIHWIREYNSVENGYNSTYGGRGGKRERKPPIPCLISFWARPNLYVEDIVEWSNLNGYDHRKLKKLSIPKIDSHKDIVGIEWNWKREE